ncbi:MAG: hypothetical protein ABW166_04995 [Sedimenticola sp.]
MGQFKKLDQELQELTMSDLKNWEESDKFKVGLKLEDFHNNSFIEWLKSEGHIVTREDKWITINGQKMINVSDIFAFLSEEKKEKKRKEIMILTILSLINSCYGKYGCVDSEKEKTSSEDEALYKKIIDMRKKNG